MIVKQFHTPDGVLERELTVQEVLEYFLFPSSEYIGKITGFTIGAIRPLNITIEWEGYTLNYACFVTQDLVDQYSAGKLKVGDWVIIAFLEGHYNRAIARQKVFQTW